MPFRYAKSAERPTVQIWWFSEANSLIDFSAGYTWSLKIGTPGSTALLTKTSGIVGAAGSGVNPTGVPNVVITWTAGELNLTPGVWSFELTATTGGLDRVLRDGIEIVDTIT